MEPLGFDARKATSLLETSRALLRKTASPFYHIYHELLQGIISVCRGGSLGAVRVVRHADTHFAGAVTQLAQLRDPWARARAFGIVTESLVKLGQLEPHRRRLKESFTAAWNGVEAASATTDRDRYEKVQLFASLLVAAAQADWHTLIHTGRQGRGAPIDTALQAIEEISDVFYRVRGAALLFTVLGVLGKKEWVCQAQPSPLTRLLDFFDAELRVAPVRVADGVHAGYDYYMFPLSLVLNAIAVLRCPEYLDYRRPWLAEARVCFGRLAAASRASQLTFYVHALSNLAVLTEHVADVRALLSECVRGYLQTTDGKRTDDYLRCTYLVHLASNMASLELVDRRVWTVLGESIPDVAGSARYRESAYGSSYMVAAYTMSALEAGGRIQLLFSDELNLARAIGSFKDDARATAANLPKLSAALVDSALRLRPAGWRETKLFESLRLPGAGTAPRSSGEATADGVIEAQGGDG